MEYAQRNYFLKHNRTVIYKNLSAHINKRTQKKISKVCYRVSRTGGSCRWRDVRRSIMTLERCLS